jgi:alkylhydroperoxidase family enzyme
VKDLLETLAVSVFATLLLFLNPKRNREMSMTRIQPVRPPYSREVGERLEAMMPPGVPPIRLFRTFVQNLPMTTAMGGWGSYELSKHLSLTMRDREIVIDRTCARCSCEYEWGVHVAFFAERVALSPPQVASLTHGEESDPCWTDERDRLLIEAVDALHDTADIDDTLWQRLSAIFGDQELLDLLLLCGWYHAISFAANGARVAREDGAPRFADVLTAQTSSGTSTSVGPRGVKNATTRDGTRKSSSVV